jgi:hypothetical protein
LSTLWKKEFELMDEASGFTFRNYGTVNHYLQRYWDLASNNFYPLNVKKLGKKFQLTKENLKSAKDYMVNEKHALICLNDDPKIQDFNKMKDEINTIFEKILPDKSDFES